MNNSPTLLGTISAVSSSSAVVELADSVESGIVILEGRNYRVGQVGSFVKILLGYNNLYGVIAGSSESSQLDDQDGIHLDRRWIKIELIGEIVAGEFERGISEYPSIGNEVHIVVDSDLKKIFGKDIDGHFNVGTLSSSDGISVSLDLDKLVTRHSAIFGSTGSGKSTSTASILRSMVTAAEKINMPSARILLIDIHGEYQSALGDIANVFSVLPDAENKLYVPYWCISPTHLMEFLCGTLSDSQKAIFLDKTVSEKISSITTNNFDGVNPDKVTSSTPLPYSIKKIWHELCFLDNVNWKDKDQTEPAYAINGLGDCESLIAPKFQPPAPGNTPPFKGGAGLMKRQLDLMKSRLADTQYSFMLEPGEWGPNKDGVIEKDLDALVEGWLGHEKPITILDLSGMPSSRLSLLLGTILDVLFEVSIWGREMQAGMRKRPLLLVLEEAHRYLSKSETGLAKEMVQRISKEGRKFGVGAMLVSQRPSEIDETILSQCGTIISLRINNTTDRGIVKSAMSEGLSGIVDTLPILRTGEAIIVGEAAKLPTRCRFNLLPDDKYPNSKDPCVADSWKKPKEVENYKELINSWRSQTNNQG
ncbi:MULTISPECIES: ATP-binding protein [Pseudomonas]|uniref:ATP-binding protein n=1 Tax=Pseudomonas TaxID=286 RepID=UPI000449E648|nr:MULTISPECIES: ATP-binding protein [Pseudomonas]EKL0657555.1 ATP-binding protein [Pseudomonas aeruginosa]EKL8241021.1 ATP-binding protein [Pseudomonas aeruginosa]EKL8598664.1 ATP-binding protein [Pseudomonas aeruginosa]EKP5708600.1 ATP-binding protein [Pseudomonas aeruginosa]EKT0598962.1 ATP-binding protein [Pseudomonas aeruginosa]